MLTSWKENCNKVAINATTTLTQVIEAKGVQLCQLGRNEQGIQRGVIFWDAAIVGILNFFQVVWPTDVIREAAILSYSEAYYLTGPELQMFVYRVKTGYYKSAKNMAPPILLEFVRDYANEVHNARPSVYAHEKKPVKEQPLKLHYSKIINRKGLLFAKAVLSDKELCHFLTIGAQYRAAVSISRVKSLAQEIEDKFGIEKKEQKRRAFDMEINKLKVELLHIRIGIRNNKFTESELPKYHQRIAELEQIIKKQTWQNSETSE
jgi:hypothetical protein